MRIFDWKSFARIERGLLTGSTLARATDFQQAHISNFLNRKRSLSLEGLDRVLAAQKLSVIDLLPPDSLPAIPASTGNASSAQTIAVVTHTAASSSARIQTPEIIDTIEVPEAIIHSSRAHPLPGRNLMAALCRNSRRCHPGSRDGASSTPALYRCHRPPLQLPHALSPPPPTVYAVRGSDALHLCFLEYEADRLILRPRNQQIPVLLIALAPNEQPADRVVGRVCYVLSEF